MLAARHVKTWATLLRDTSRCAVFVGENSMKLAKATNTNRKFGKPRDLLCALTPTKAIFASRLHAG